MDCGVNVISLISSFLYPPPPLRSAAVGCGVSLIWLPTHPELWSHCFLTRRWLDNTRIMRPAPSRRQKPSAGLHRKHLRSVQRDQTQLILPHSFNLIQRRTKTWFNNQLITQKVFFLSESLQSGWSKWMSARLCVCVCVCYLANIHLSNTPRCFSSRGTSF